MLGEQLIKLYNDFGCLQYIGVDDFVDRLSFLYSMLVLLLAGAVVAIKQYMLAGIACYAATTPSGDQYDKYMENYCWVHGTIPLLANMSTPNEDQWAKLDKTQRISYYQWVPFVLGLQCLLFYLPHLAWNALCENTVGSNLNYLIGLAAQANRSDTSVRKSQLNQAATILHTILTRRKLKCSHSGHTVSDVLCCSATRFLGTRLLRTYLLVKMLYLLNACCQLYLMHHFLGFTVSLIGFGPGLALQLMLGNYWPVTLIFPRVSYCFLEGIRQLGSHNNYLAQCVLPLNMLNEKIYLFLWFWISFVAICTVGSLLSWLVWALIESRRKSALWRYARLSYHLLEAYDAITNLQCNLFYPDGLFILNMIARSAGDATTAEIIYRMLKIQKRAKPAAAALCGGSSEIPLSGLSNNNCTENISLNLQTKMP